MLQSPATMPMRRAHHIICALMILSLSRPGLAEPSRRQVPVVGLHMQPSLSVLIGSDLVTEVYGHAHPTGSLGISLHPSERFYLILELEAQGWSGTYDPPGGTPIDMRFLNYWLHARGRTFVYRRGRFGLALDAEVGVLFAREDGDHFRAEGQGISISAGPAIQIDLGTYLALSLCTLVGSGWAWYDIESPQSSAGDSEYELAWPRLLVGLALHGFVVRRTVRPARAPEPAAAPEPVETPPAAPELPSPFDV
jgi:hypothetical protein